MVREVTNFRCALSEKISGRGHYYHVDGLAPLHFDGGTPGSVGVHCIRVRDSQADNPGRVYNSALINGIGRYNGGPDVPLAVVNVVQHLR